MKSPESLTPAVRFMSETLKSPSCPKLLKRNPINAAFAKERVSCEKKIVESPILVKVPTTKPAIVPSTVFRGLIGVLSLCFPTALPIR